jgi:hypothetical protein
MALAVWKSVGGGVLLGSNGVSKASKSYACSYDPSPLMLYVSDTSITCSSYESSDGSLNFEANFLLLLVYCS